LDYIQNRIGERGQMIGEALDGQRAAEVLRQKPQRLRLLKMA